VWDERVRWVHSRDWFECEKEDMKEPVVIVVVGKQDFGLRDH
jgi:hypothetical protein